jgi:hypothetical protein
MACKFTNSKGKSYWLHERKNARGGQMRWFSFKEADSVDLPIGFTVIEGPTGLPFAKRTNTTGV